MPFLGKLVTLIHTYKISKALSSGQSHYTNCLGVLRILMRDAVHSLKSLVEMKNYHLCYSSIECFYYA